MFIIVMVIINITSVYHIHNNATPPAALTSKLSRQHLGSTTQFRDLKAKRSV